MKVKNYELTPKGLLFFRDGRPIDVDKSERDDVRNIGHGASWPRPDLLFKGAMHALLNNRQANERQHFGEFTELKVAGPYPVARIKQKDGTEKVAKFLPFPLDWGMNVEKMLKDESDLPEPLSVGFVDSVEGKKSYPQWIALEDYLCYLDGQEKSMYVENADTEDACVKFPYGDDELYVVETRMGTTMDPCTGASRRVEDRYASGQYQADYLRLCPQTTMWCSIDTGTRRQKDEVSVADEVPRQFIFGGQGGMIERKDTALDPIDDLRRWCAGNQPKPDVDGSVYVRWTLLAPALWNETGWLPSFCRDSRKDKSESERMPLGQVMFPGCEGANLVGARVGKAIWFSGWDTLVHVKPTVLAVPAGSAYLFKCSNAECAKTLVEALNLRRRSDLGEQGFGIGVCSYVNPPVKVNN